MPELPEVETMVRGIRKDIEGRIITQMVKCRCTRKPISIFPAWRTMKARVSGQVIESVTRRAKRIVMHLGSGDRIVVEPRMTGLMLLADPPTHEHLRFEWHFRNEGRLWFWDRRGLGTVSLLTPQQYEERVEARLGPEALDVSVSQLTECFTDRHRAIKVLLLDQSKIAGIGNLYASEILHRAGVHPERLASSLDESETERIHEAIRHVLSEAIRYEGSTLSDGTYRNALNKDGGYQNEHRVYARADEICPNCQGSNIQRIVQAQRSTFFCGTCQK